MQFLSIGQVKSPVQEAVDEHWGEVVAEIHLHAEFAKGLQGLQDFSHAIILFYMHQAHFEVENDLIRRPRGQADMPEVGIFAQRAKHRPNSIGISPVEIVEIRGDILVVRGLDAIDGTPVLDIKPYFPVFDLVETATVPEWVNRLMQGYF